MVFNHITCCNHANRICIKDFKNIISIAFNWMGGSYSHIDLVNLYLTLQLGGGNMEIKEWELKKEFDEMVDDLKKAFADMWNPKESIKFVGLTFHFVVDDEVLCEIKTLSDGVMEKFEVE